MVRGSIRNPGLKSSIIYQSPAESIIQKPYCVSTKGNLLLPKRTGVSPKTLTIHKGRSPSYIEQQNAVPLKRSTGLFLNQ